MPALSGCVSSSTTPCAGGNIFTTIIIKIAAKILVNKKVPAILDIILPKRFNPSILAIDDAMLKNTRGTTIVNIKFKKMSPSGFKATASAPMK